jgi:hypothetical protein
MWPNAANCPGLPSGFTDMTDSLNLSDIKTEIVIPFVSSAVNLTDLK